jgi:membrane associated rhomboid family serine protease
VFLPLRDDAPRSRIPYVTISLIAVNLIVFAIQQSLSAERADALLSAGGAIPCQVSRCERPLSLLTSLFLHGGPEHLLGTLWFLWIFGDNVEDAMGRARYLGFYLLTGCFAIAAQAAMTPASEIPIVGASGAIAGILGAFFCLYPRARVEVVLFVILIVQVVIVPAFFLLGVWVAWQLIAGSGGGTVAIWAHIWGFLVGAVVCKLFVPRPKRIAPWNLTAQGSSSLPL